MEPVAVPTVLEREIELDLPADEMWRLMSTADGWQEWLVDSARLDVAAGAEGEVMDDGLSRRVLVDEVSEGRVRFVWTGEGEERSVVTLRLEDALDGRSRLRVTEEWFGATACADCPRRSLAWDVRECLLCLRAQAVVRA